jgi:hypothetical protein
LKEQTWQLVPPAPHAWTEVPWTQAPLLSTHPAHAVSGMQLPTELQAWFPLQEAHVPPPTPHSARAVPAWQTPFESQQPLQFVGPHCPPPSPAATRHSPEAHSSPGTHATQTDPWEPQAACCRPGRHCPLGLQQPVQVVLLQSVVVEPHPAAPSPTATAMSRRVALISAKVPFRLGPKENTS